MIASLFHLLGVPSDHFQKVSQSLIVILRQILKHFQIIRYKYIVIFLLILASCNVCILSFIHIYF